MVRPLDTVTKEAVLKDWLLGHSMQEIGVRQGVSIGSVSKIVATALATGEETARQMEKQRRIAERGRRSVPSHFTAASVARIMLDTNGLAQQDNSPKPLPGLTAQQCQHVLLTLRNAIALLVVAENVFITKRAMLDELEALVGFVTNAVGTEESKA